MDANLKPAPYDPPQWHKRGPHVYLEGRSHLDGVDALAVEMERKWGIDRLRLLVDQELRLRFDRQRVKFNTALWHGDLPEVEREAARMATAWRTLDAAATAAGARPIEPEVLAECVVDAVVVAIVRDEATGRAVREDGRARQVWTLAEIERVLAAFPAVVKAKHTFPGATVASVKPPADPLLALPEDEIPFITSEGYI
jgi:hypothetical protein